MAAQADRYNFANTETAIEEEAQILISEANIEETDSRASNEEYEPAGSVSENSLLRHYLITRSLRLASPAHEQSAYYEAAATAQGRGPCTNVVLALATGGARTLSQADRLGEPSDH